MRAAMVGLLWCVAAGLTSLAAPVCALAQSPAAPLSEEQRRSELTAAWQAGERAGTKGPAEVTLIDQASLQLPADHFYIPKPEGTRIMRALGNTVGDNKFLGLIVGTKPSDQWIVVTQYNSQS